MQFKIQYSVDSINFSNPHILPSSLMNYSEIYGVKLTLHSHSKKCLKCQTDQIIITTIYIHKHRHKVSIFTQTFELTSS